MSKLYDMDGDTPEPLDQITLNEIYSKLRTKEDIINYFQENGK